MNRRLAWFAAAFIAAMVAAYFFVPARRSLPPPLIKRDSPAPVARKIGPEPEISAAIPVLQPPAVMAATVTVPAPQPKKILVPPPMEVPIQNGATIDFSVGAPIVRSGPDDTAALNKGLKEIDDAIKDVAFPAKPPEKK